MTATLCSTEYTDGTDDLISARLRAPDYRQWRAQVETTDGREIGRERVSDLRGALHHYGPASAGWLLTTGQVLSGAREESGAPAAPIALFDGIAVQFHMSTEDADALGRHIAAKLAGLERVASVVQQRSRGGAGEAAARQAGLAIATFTDLSEGMEWMSQP